MSIFYRRGHCMVGLAACLWVFSALAQEFHPTDVASLIAAINVANGNGADDTIFLGDRVFNLTAVDNVLDGNNGLPSILSDSGHKLLIKDGTITASQPGSPNNFRLLHLST